MKICQSREYSVSEKRKKIVYDALCKRFEACLVGDDGPTPAVRVQNNQILSRHQQ